jgi:signal transduction histidine kinase
VQQNAARFISMSVSRPSLTFARKACPLSNWAGLSPLNQLANQAASITADSLATRFPTEIWPGELTPISSRLNDLLERLEQSFERERRFSADLAHELRTPIAELRSLAELALKWPEDCITKHEGNA